MLTPLKKSRWSLLIPVLVTCMAQAVSAAQVAHVSDITEGLTSPTSLLVTNDGIAVLEPFAQQLVVFSPDGLLTRRVEISGEAQALAHLEERTYLFCERSVGKIVRVDLNTSQQSVFLEGVGDPVDVIVTGDTCRILDAQGGRILICDLAGHLTDTITLAIPGDLAGTWLADLAWDPNRALYYAWDQTYSRVLAFSETGAYQGNFSSFGSQDGAVTRGGEIVCDQDGWLYICDRYQGQIVVFDADWNFVLNIQPAELGSRPLVIPAGLAVDSTGFVYVACTEGAIVEVFHLDKAPAPLDIPFAAPVSPADGEMISGTSQHLVAGIQAPAALASGLTVEFEVFEIQEPSVVVAGITGLPLVDPVTAGNLIIGTTSWTLPSDLTAGQSYLWHARAVSGALTGDWSLMRSFKKGALPLIFRLQQNVPNPFNPLTVISFVLTGEGRAQLEIYDIRGRRVWQKDLSNLGAGQQEISWHGKDQSGNQLASGIYFYRLVEAGRSQTRKMALMK